MNKADTVAFKYAKEKGTVGLDYNQIYDAVKHGYHQAEMDNELTWEDLKLLQNISHGIFAETANGSVEFYQVYPTEQSFFEEILERFKDYKERKEKCQ